jgi:ABC-2 type transport system ATP-binding protein
VLRELTLDIRRGELAAVMGPNGSGKSTLLKIIAGLTAPTEGTRTIAADPEPVRIGYAPDRLPKLKFTAREYLAHMAGIAGLPSGSAAVEIDFYLAELGLHHADKLQMRHFSKGMLQKVNLAQALLTKPTLLLLDEPFGGLDSGARSELMRLLEQLKGQGTTIVAASHDKEWVERLADRCLTIRDGTIVEDERSARQKIAVRELVCLLPVHISVEAFERAEGDRLRAGDWRICCPIRQAAWCGSSLRLSGSRTGSCDSESCRRATSPGPWFTQPFTGR